ncbi:unnamed protein product [Symbiodinium pilosum]|uniref:Uncharacterized protein n=1 Tax=Symbiodinium pilosum TaxID=2952 RepID=A0A812M7F4_SYMPI|nr:unnamed protein product [Symbiodinium pilosum]
MCRDRSASKTSEPTKQPTEAAGKVLINVWQLSGNQLLSEYFNREHPVRAIFDRIIALGLGNPELAFENRKLDLDGLVGHQGFGDEATLTAVALKNLALRKPCRMSSNYTHPGTEEAPRERYAVDGDSSDGSLCAHTLADKQAWWEAMALLGTDLEGSIPEQSLIAEGLAANGLRQNPVSGTRRGHPGSAEEDDPPNCWQGTLRPGPVGATRVPSAYTVGGAN